METEPEFAVSVRYFQLDDSLQDYFTVLTLFDIDCPDGQQIADQLHPEWTAMRFVAKGQPPSGCVGTGDLAASWPIVASGPTSKSLRFSLYRSKIWGLGLLPPGFARFMHCPASEMADRIVDCDSDDAFKTFTPILEIISGAADDDEVAGQVNQYLLSQTGKNVPQERQIKQCQEALRDGSVATVTELADRLGLGRRSLERMCSRYFGFPPKMLLRRQRFLRSLAQFTVAPTSGWIHALDSQYYDQAHFVRDFKAFMGVTPTEYAAAPHPVLDRIIGQRMIDQGAAQATDLPTIVRYTSDAGGASG